MVIVDPARPMRADARRNYERILATAKEIFTAKGTEVPLDDIAKCAQVGPGTLYRHFPTREKLIEAVFRDEIDQLAQRAFILAEQLSPWEALKAWMEEEVTYAAERHGLAQTLKASIDQGSETFGWCQVRLREASGILADAAHASGELRKDITNVDLLRIAHGIGTASVHGSSEDRRRMLAVVIDGLKAANAS